MFATSKKYFFVLTLASFSFAFIHCPAYATLYTYTIDAIADAGLTPGQDDFVGFFLKNSSTTVLVPSSSEFTNADAVHSYASTHPEISGAWELQSAGNIWDPSQTTVGKTTPLLPAGTYQVSVAAAGAFTYDSFGWSNYYGQWLWLLNIKSDVPANGGTPQLLHDYTLGSSDLYSTSAAAFDASKNSFVDITLESSGYLTFWIYDTNSIDNFGSLKVNVASVPEPSSLLLLIAGLPVLILGGRQHISVLRKELRTYFLLGFQDHGSGKR